MRFGRKARDEQPPEFPAEWRAVLARQWPLWRMLSVDERARLEVLALGLLSRVRFEASNGFELTDEMCVLVAAQASLLVLELGPEPYRRIRTVIVHPASMVQSGARRTGAGGLMTDEPQRIDGQAHSRGEIVLAWDAVAYDARHPWRGLNVVLHEFAHQLDMLDGMVDGTPPLLDAALRARWVEVCTREYQAVRRGDDHLLRSYAGTDPGEFFAVATEMFFTRPAQLAEHHPALYDVLRDFYRQHPAGRDPAAVQTVDRS